jgi:hypothetical protein
MADLKLTNVEKAYGEVKVLEIHLAADDRGAGADHGGRVAD